MFKGKKIVGCLKMFDLRTNAWGGARRLARFGLSLLPSLGRRTADYRMHYSMMLGYVICMDVSPCRSLRVSLTCVLECQGSPLPLDRMIASVVSTLRVSSPRPRLSSQLPGCASVTFANFLEGSGAPSPQCHFFLIWPLLHQ